MNMFNCKVNINLGSTGSDTSSYRSVKSSNKFSVVIGFILLLVISYFILNLITIENKVYKPFITPKNEQVDRYEYLKSKKKLSKDEKTEYCHLADIIDNIILKECVCDGNKNKTIDKTGIDWLFPPNIDDITDFGYEEFSPTNKSNYDKRRYFRHKKYTDIVIGFDFGHDSYDENGEVVEHDVNYPHWHRYKNYDDDSFKNVYINECQELTRRGKLDAHIFIDSNKVKVLKSDKRLKQD